MVQILPDSQKVRIGKCTSSSARLELGVPQGGILFSLIFVKFVSDLEDWLLFLKVFTYADDTSTSVKGKTLL